MLSGRLVQAIENHWEDIAGRLIQKLRQHHETPHLAERSDAEIRDWCEEILSNLTEWLSVGHAEEARRRFEASGRARFAEDTPLHEAVLRFHLLKEAVIDFAHNEWVPVNSMQFYAEEELERRLHRFFDSLLYYVVYGYEKARRSAVKYA